MTTPTDNELEVWAQVAPGRAVRVRMSTIEEGLPTPGESDHVRQPYLPEILKAAESILHNRMTLAAPF